MTVTIPDVWELDPDTPAWLPSIITRLLSAGVPPTAIARAFEMAVEPVRDLQFDLRISQYGTAEIGELVTDRIFRSFDMIEKLLREAPPNRQIALHLAFISKASAFAGRQTPDTIAKLGTELESVFREVRSTPAPVVGSIYETVAADAPIDNPEERPLSRET